jgi:hypothetical protein
MKHPNREEWIEYLNDETSPEVSRQLREHLKQCRDCATEFTAWQNVIQSLPSWRVPEPERILRPNFVPASWNRGLVAALLMAVACVAGSFFYNQDRELKQLRNQVAGMAKEREATPASGAAKSEQLTREVANLSAELARLARLTSKATNEIQRTMSGLEQVNRANREAILELAAGDKEARDREHLALANLVREAEYRQETRLSLLRQDLETVASTADDQFQLTRQNLVRISTSARPVSRRQP